MDLEAESIVSVDTGMSSDIAESCNKLLETQKQIESAEEELKKLKDVETTLSEQTIPNLMQQAGISMLKLADGSSVEVKPFYSARIPESRVDEAFSWLRNKGFGDLIKNTVTTTFNRGQDNQVAELVKVCEQHGFKYLQKQKVEPMTLKAFAKEQVEKGKELPFDLFGIYIANKAKLKTKE